MSQAEDMLWVGLLRALHRQAGGHTAVVAQQQVAVCAGAVEQWSCKAPGEVR